MQIQLGHSMDSLEKQVITLDTKVDALYQITDQLSKKMSEMVTELRSGSTNRSYSVTHGVSMQSSGTGYSRQSRLESTMEHKDVLVDSNYLEADEHKGERELAPEIQIRRLTAQLTAAYNRIAALEEQLLSQRVH